MYCKIMRLTVKEQRLLNLGKTEKIVLKALYKLEKASIKDIAAYTKLPRTTLYWPLLQLQKRDIVAFTLRGKRKLWHLTNLTISPIISSAVSTPEGISVVEGVSNIHELYQRALNQFKTERVLILEGNKAVHSIADKSGLSFMLTWHKEAQRREIILESIVGEKTYNAIRQKQIRKEVLKSLGNFKLWIAYVLPDKFLEGDAALLLFQNVAIITDWSQERSILIQTPEVVQLIRGFCEALKLLGSKVDIVTVVREYKK